MTYLNNYETHYESYYNGIRKGVQKNKQLSRRNNGVIKKNQSYIYKKIIFQLSGSLLLILGIFTFKVVPNEEFKDMYIYTKFQLNKDIDTIAVFNNTFSIDLNKYKEKGIEFIESIKNFKIDEETNV